MAQVTAELALEITRLKAGLDQARAEIRGFKARAQAEGDGIGKALFGKIESGLGALGVGVGVGAAAGGIKSILGRYDDIADTALKLNESTETVQRVAEVARLSGTSIEGVANAALKLEKALGEVENTKAREALERYGVTARDLIGLPLDQKILVLSEAFQKAREDGTGYNDLLTLLGKSSAELIPMLSQTKEALQEAFAGVAVIKDQDVQQMAKLNDELDAMVGFGQALIALRLKDNLNWGAFLKDIVTTGSIEQALGKVGERQMDADREKKRLQESKEAQAEATQSLQDEGAAKEQVKVDARGAKASDELESLRIAVLPDEERLEALKGKVQEIFGSLQGVQEMAGLDEVTDEESMVQWVESFKEYPLALEQAVGLLKQVRALNEQISTIEQKQASDEEKAAKELEALRERAEKGGRKLMTPQEQANALREDLAKSLGMEVTSGKDVQDGLARLRKEAEDARGRGDAAGEQDALKRLDEAQQQAGDLAGLGGQDVGRAALVGETAGVVNAILGRSGNDLVLDETRQQTGSLRNIETMLRDWLQRPGEMGGGGGDAFGFNPGD